LGNLAQLVCLRQTIGRVEIESDCLDLLKMAALGILIPISNAKHNHVSLTFSNAPRPTIDVADVLEQQLCNMASDLREVRGLPCADVRIYEGNSKELSAVLKEDRKVSAVITSPPYPNRFS
jgi:hypothetical protein